MMSKPNVYECQFARYPSEFLVTGYDQGKVQRVYTGNTEVTCKLHGLSERATLENILKGKAANCEDCMDFVSMGELTRWRRRYWTKTKRY